LSVADIRGAEMDLILAIRSYLHNLPTALGFALLLVFVLPFAWLSNAFISSGTVLIGYGFLKEPALESVVLLVLALAFLFFYSLLVCLMVLAVRRDLSAVKTHYYLSEKIQKFGMKYFRLLAAFTLLAAIISAALVGFGVPVIVINILLFLLSASLLFLPQTIVVDEEGLFASVLSNWDFIAKNPGTFLFVMLAGIVGVFCLQLLEFAVDYFVPAGSFLSLLVALVVMVPIFEAVKTLIYMKRFSLIASYAPHM